MMSIVCAFYRTIQNCFYFFSRSSHIIYQYSLTLIRQAYTLSGEVSAAVTKINFPLDYATVSFDFNNIGKTC